jgi:hypothetical protein
MAEKALFRRRFRKAIVRKFSIIWAGLQIMAAGNREERYNIVSLKGEGGGQFIFGRGWSYVVY